MKTAFILSLIIILSLSACGQSMTPNNPDRVIQLSSSNFKYTMDGADNPTITVSVGETVRIDLAVTEGFHDFVIDEFNARTEQINAGQTSSTTFIADTPGTYEYYCSVGNHREMGMRGTLVVQ
jgi:plastocyanin